MGSVYLDESVAAALKVSLRQNRHDVEDAKELGHRHRPWSDARHLLYAARTGRVLITDNLKDFLLLHDAWRRWPAPRRDPQEHAGIIVFDQRLVIQPQRLATVAALIGALADLGAYIRNELWDIRGGECRWYHWRDDGYQRLAIATSAIDPRRP